VKPGAQSEKNEILYPRKIPRCKIERSVRGREGHYLLKGRKK